MLIGSVGVIVLALFSLYLYDAYMARQRRENDPVKFGLDPQFASISEDDWCELTLSTERARW